MQYVLQIHFVDVTYAISIKNLF